MTTTLTISGSSGGFQRGDIIDVCGERYKVSNVINGYALTVRNFGWIDRLIWSKFFQLLIWQPLRIWRCSDWMPESYYWEQECNQILRKDISNGD